MEDDGFVVGAGEEELGGERGTRNEEGWKEVSGKEGGREGKRGKTNLSIWRPRKSSNADGVGSVSSYERTCFDVEDEDGSGVA